jgi:CubicO group peptidase (beta-lactamase class C family)
MPAPSTIQTALEQAVAAEVFPGAVLAVRRGHGPVMLATAGRLSIDPPGEPVSRSTVYDLASLTKPLATVTSLALLLQEGKCRLDNHVGDLLPELTGTPVGSATLRHLLTHSSGLSGWRPFYQRLSPSAMLPSSAQARADAARRLLQEITQEALIYRPDERSVYSDLGFMLLGFVVERVSGVTLDRFVIERVVEPLKAHPLAYRPCGSPAHTSEHSSAWSIAPTEFDSWRGRLLCGEVHDENAAVLGGVAGHAGLFGTAEAVLAVTGAWLGGYHGRESILTSDVVRLFTSRWTDVDGSSWALGWDTPSSPSSSGERFSGQSFGHLGYTGTSIWIDPLSELEVVLLSNRVHPTRRNERIRVFRPAIHDLVYREFVRPR